ncbi:uncharacterized protein FIBRA_02121 [Fibroporia radiculosa]|uniref:Uncharacterized protein n=1 Tax=Fibroporia radiculosa TaxID=599839 RepID=J4H1N7_9APHY|nr:uncharacterized protein FIBRA_02121 [Fibroporia radiculosa]CCM00094.1 predicted protein [Fibroporia radiculosa]
MGRTTGRTSSIPPYATNRTGSSVRAAVVLVRLQTGDWVPGRVVGRTNTVSTQTFQVQYDVEYAVNGRILRGTFQAQDVQPLP